MTRFLLLLLFVISCEDKTVLHGNTCNLPCYTGPWETLNTGECKQGKPVCDDGFFVECAGEILPEQELCDGLDNDCNDIIDDEVKDEIAGNNCGIDTGSCLFGSMECVDAKLVCVDFIGPTDEVCNGIDDDCNGFADDGLELGFCYDGPDGSALVGECRIGEKICARGSIECGGQVLPRAEICNGLDDDCDGMTDEDLGENFDVVFVLDVSSSMQGWMLEAVDAMIVFSDSHLLSDQRFAWIVTPDDRHGWTRKTDLVDALTFGDSLTVSPPRFSPSGNEAFLDVAYGLISGSIAMNWRDESRKYIVFFSDEAPASHQGVSVGSVLSSGIVLVSFGHHAFMGFSDHHLPMNYSMETNLRDVVTGRCE